jgi:hypothetical protein
MSRYLFCRGDRVRLMVRTKSGWLGTGTVVIDQVPGDPVVDFRKDDVGEGEDPEGFAHWSELMLIDQG